MAAIRSALAQRWQRMLAAAALAASIAFTLVVASFEILTNDFDGALQAAQRWAVLAGIAAALTALVPDERPGILRRVRLFLLLTALALWLWWTVPPGFASWLPDNSCYTTVPTIGPGSLLLPEGVDEELFTRCAARFKAHVGWIVTAGAALLASVPRRTRTAAWLAAIVFAILLVALTVNIHWVTDDYLAEILVWIVLAVVLAVLPTAGLMLLPVYLASFVLSRYRSQEEGAPSRSDLIEVQNSMRTTLMQLFGGVILLATVFFTWQQVGLGRESQITERFTRAIDQLGNADSVDVRMGGIHALRRIARDSPSDQEAISDILSQYVRERAPSDREPIRKATAAELQAALVALSALDVPVDLSRTNLSGVRLSEANFGGCNLSQSTLRDMALVDANLIDANLSGSNLSETNLTRAALSGAVLNGAVLTGANLESATLDGAVLDKADLRSVKGLESATLDGAQATQATTWPSGFDPEEHGVTVS